MDQKWVLTMTLREIDRLKVIDQILRGKLSKSAAARELKLSRRQVIRICKRVKKEGNRAVIHKLRGKASNRSLPQRTLDLMAGLIRKKYEDFGPTLAKEKLAQSDGINVSVSTVRRVMIEAEIWKPRRIKFLYRTCRERRAAVGELIQVDGCNHDWFEGRAGRCNLISFIDDATSRILYAQFVDSESTFQLLRLAGEYIRKYGRPVAFYVDKDSIYKVNRQPTIEEQLRDLQPPTQFSRAMKDLGIQMIFANSPQAKGRVERSFKTLQDRLVKELRLRGISTIPKANRYLIDEYLPEFNARFAVRPTSLADAHRPLLSSQDIEAILSFRTPRTVFNDYTVRFKNRFFQLADSRLRLRPRAKVEVEIRLNSSINIRFNGNICSFAKSKNQPNRFLKNRFILLGPENHRSHQKIIRADTSDCHEQLGEKYMQLDSNTKILFPFHRNPKMESSFFACGARSLRSLASIHTLKIKNKKPGVTFLKNERL